MTQKDNETVRVLMDLESKSIYAVRMNADGDCVGIHRMSEGSPFRLPGQAPSSPNQAPTSAYPFGATTYAMEVSKAGKIEYATIVWPSEDEMKKSIMPKVGFSEIRPEALVKAKLVVAPETLDQKKGTIDEEKLQEALDEMMGYIGLEGVKKDILNFVSLARFELQKRELLAEAGLEDDPFAKSAKLSLHMVYTGDPGTGKTTIARSYAKLLKALGFIKKDNVVEALRQDLVAGYVGQTAIKTQAKIEEAMDGILFIDEAYALSRNKGSQNDFGQEAIDTLVAGMENNRDRLVVIVAGYSEPMKQFIDANEGLKSRFQTYLEFKNYDARELSEILDYDVAKRGLRMTAEARSYASELLASELAASEKDKKSFGNGRAVRNLIDKAYRQHADNVGLSGVFGDATKSREEKIEALRTLTVEDFSGISLTGVKVKKGSYSFDVDDAATPANDTRGLKIMPDEDAAHVATKAKATATRGPKPSAR